MVVPSDSQNVPLQQLPQAEQGSDAALPQAGRIPC